VAGEVKMPKEKFKFLEHTADVKFQSYGKSLEETFENAALAMFKVMYGGRVRGKIKKKIEVKGKDLENLLYNFLEELLFLLDSEGFFLSKVRVEVDEKNLKIEADLLGDKAERYKISSDVKAITYNEMFVKKEKDKFICQVVLDV
jgi:SHS2 domain-containing protein